MDDMFVNFFCFINELYVFIDNWEFEKCHHDITQVEIKKFFNRRL